MLGIRRLFCVLGFLAVATGPAMTASKDESRLPPSNDTVTAEVAAPLPLPSAGTGSAPATDSGTTPDSGTSPDSGTTPDTGPTTDQQDPTDQGQDLTAPGGSQPDAGSSEDGSGEDMSLGDIPEVKTVELTLDVAKRALDTYLAVKEKYKDADLESYDNLQDFVDKNEQGKAFEADIKAAGFASVDEWNTAITTLGFAYTGVIDDPTGDIKLQIEDIQADNTIAQDMKDRMIASLNAMIPSENNRKIASEMMKDPAYAEKLKALDAAEGE
jgi:hypothetical protein